MKKRLFILLSLVTVLSIFVTACGGTPEPTPPPATEETVEDEPMGPPPTLFSEAPMLADMVVAGDLPPVDDRLPPEPMIVEPYESIGEYGGTWHNTAWDGNEAGNIANSRSLPSE